MLTLSSRQRKGQNGAQSVREDDVGVLTLSSRKGGRNEGGKQREAECPSEGIGPYELTFEGHSAGSALNARTIWCRGTPPGAR